MSIPINTLELGFLTTILIFSGFSGIIWLPESPQNQESSSNKRLPNTTRQRVTSRRTINNFLIFNIILCSPKLPGKNFNQKRVSKKPLNKRVAKEGGSTVHAKMDRINEFSFFRQRMKFLRRTSAGRRFWVNKRIQRENL